MRETVENASNETADAVSPGKVSRLVWITLPTLVLIPSIFYFFVGQSSQVAELAVLICGLVAAYLVGRHLYQVYEHNRLELEELRAQALANCEQRDAAISTLGNFFSEVLPIWARQIKLAQDHAREEVEVLAQHFDRVVSSFDSAEEQRAEEVYAQESGDLAEVVVSNKQIFDLSAEERQEIRDSLDKILISLQFQDRVNQILEAVGLNLEQIAAHIDQILANDSDASLEEVLSLSSWLELMQENYTMVEQKIVHHEDVEVSAAPNADNNEIEFF